MAESRELALNAQAQARKVRSFEWAPTASEATLARALEALAEAFIIETCIGSDPCGLCRGCKKAEVLNG